MRFIVVLICFSVFFSCAHKNSVKRCPEVIKGYASYYGKKYHRRKTASGEIYNMYDYTAAHRFLPFGSIIVVKNLKNGKKVKVRINDRGPFVRGRVLDLSYVAAKKLGMIRDGIVPVIATVIRCGN
ncbi:rare lipoprotein A [Persephonella hydrogeniphila]|uniref:Probable endolytic peptidoglycan transglycosylase RlpA n=1 Tax=Persephonella hydrogeniphila TaxID=198703 RepID=A0A285NPB2_9AQUI|nr:septal ring lytic transglycosylase RlpA family protein [Persephonella hydrogeniphila]SNZ11352.1 rare lipoprotein A [Persephonella hydrogeniphila]